jgi:hypothetical protein
VKAPTRQNRSLLKPQSQAGRKGFNIHGISPPGQAQLSKSALTESIDSRNGMGLKS